MDTKHLAIEEVHEVLKNPNYRGAWEKLFDKKKKFMFSSAGFSFIVPGNQYNFREAPIMPCSCKYQGTMYGVAIRNGNHNGGPARAKLTLFICPKCEHVTAKPFDAYQYK